MPPRARPVGAGQEPGAEGMHRLSPLLVRVHVAVSLDQGRTAKSGVSQDLRCRVFDRFKILGSSAKYDDTLGYPTSLAEWNEGPPYQPWEDRRLPGRQHTATADSPPSGGVGQEPSAVGGQGPRRLLV